MRDTDKTFNILKGSLECKQCQYRFPYVGSTKFKFSSRINIYNSTHRKFRKKYVEKCLAEGHQDIENCSATLIDQVEDLDSLRKTELFG